MPVIQYKPFKRVKDSKAPASSLLIPVVSFSLCVMTPSIVLFMAAGMEVAAALTDKAHSVSVIGIESVPFKQALGEKVGKAIMKVEEHSEGKWVALYRRSP